MSAKLSPRLLAMVDALPLQPGMRVLEIGCGPGAMVRAMAERVGDSGFVLGIDRSRKAVHQAIAASGEWIQAGRVGFRQVPVEEFALEKGESKFDLAMAVRVGALDGRHPALESVARQRIRAALVRGGVLYVDGEPSG